jgi:hypothetical protein
MIEMHQNDSPWEWSLGPGHAIALPSAKHQRWVEVRAGRAWLTRTGAGPHQGDIWLEPGEHAPLPPGSEWVIEGWPRAQLIVVEEPLSAPA